MGKPQNFFVRERELSNLLVMFLQGFDCVAVFSQCGNSEGSGFCAADRGHDWSVRINGSRADFYFVSAGSLASGSVDDQLEFAVFQKIKRVGAAFGEFEDAANFEASF